MSSGPFDEHLSEEYEPEGDNTLEADPVDKAEQQIEVEFGEDEH